MTLRRLTLALAVVALACGSGAAFAYVSGTPKLPKCKASACVHWDSDAAMLGAHPGVVSIGHPNTGTYCVEIDPKIKVTTDLIVQLSVDYNHGSPGNANIIEFASGGTPCGANGVQVHLLNLDGTSPSFVDGSGILTIP